jgi:hypothetical protein
MMDYFVIYGFVAVLALGISHGLAAIKNGRDLIGMVVAGLLWPLTLPFFVGIVMGDSIRRILDR